MSLFGENRPGQAEQSNASPVQSPAKAKSDREDASAAAEKGGDRSFASPAPETRRPSPLITLPGGAEVPGPGVSPKEFGAFLATGIAAGQASVAKTTLPEHNLPANRLQVLEVRLHPVELGTVTARLRITEQQLSVEINAESTEGKDSLSARESAIRASLEALGFRIDRLTIQHVPGLGNSSQTTGALEAGLRQDSPAFGSTGGAGAGNAGGSRQGTGSANGKSESNGITGGAGEVASARPRDGGSGLFI